MDTNELCESLVRHVETTGSDVLEKNFVRDDKVLATVWVVVGEDAGAFARAVRRWLIKRDFMEDV
jgi:hypothetical protein